MKTIPMKTKFILAAIITAAAASSALAAIGDSFEISAGRYGAPLGKMTTQNTTVYLFQSGDAVVREVYNANNLCIESVIIGDDPAPAHLPQAVPGLEIEPQEASHAALWFLLLLPLSGLGIGLFFMRKMKSPNKAAATEKLVLEEDPSLRLSRNEMCFLKALQDAVLGEYLITFHIGLDRIIDSNATSSRLNNQQLYADFVLHNPEDSSVAAVILLQDPKSGHEQKAARIKLLRTLLEEQDIPVVLINMNHHYDPRQIQDQLAFTGARVLSPAA